MNANRDSMENYANNYYESPLPHVSPNITSNKCKSSSHVCDVYTIMEHTWPIHLASRRLFMMSILSWNICGLIARAKKSSRRKLILSPDPSFVFIHETKMENINSKSIRSYCKSNEIESLNMLSIGILSL